MGEFVKLPPELVKVATNFVQFSGKKNKGFRQRIVKTTYFTSATCVVLRKMAARKASPLLIPSYLYTIAVIGTPGGIDISGGVLQLWPVN